MRVRDLGTLAVTVDAVDRPVGGNRAPAVLAMLVINLNRRVSADELMDAVWHEDVTAGSASTLLSHIWRLRQLLEPARGRREAPTVLINDGGGYTLIGSAQTVDSLIFEQFAGDVRDLLAAGRGMQAATRADEALRLWRGRPYGALGDQHWARAAAARLAEVREQLLERRIEALLAAGELDRVLSDLEPMIAAMPLREGLWAAKMLALYRARRADEALSAFRQARAALRNELGTEPGLQLQDLQRKILANDPELAPRSRIDAAAAQEPVETHLPSALTELIGRDDDVAALAGMIAHRRLITLTGPAGSGKTRLAIEAARTSAHEFPDGVWFVDLAAIDDPDLVVDVVISTITFTPSPATTALEELRNYLRSRRILLILDNCEHVLPAVNELVEVSLGDAHEDVRCSVLATSREPLGLPGETIWTIGPLALPETGGNADPAAAPAVELFLERVRSAAPRLDLNDAAVVRAVEICRAVDGLPLALELAAARARSYTLDDIAEQVSADPIRLKRIGRDVTDHHATLGSAIEWSYRMLSPCERLAHRSLSVLPGPFTRDTAAAVIGDGTADDPGDLLSQLVHRSMLNSNGATRPGGPTMFSQLVTVRAHAYQALVESDKRDDATTRRDDWTTALIAARPRLGEPAELAWLHAVDDSYETIRATLAGLLADDHSAPARRIPPQLVFYWYYRGKMVEATRWLQLAYTASASNEPVDALLATITLACAYAVQGRVDLLRPHLDSIVEGCASSPSDRLVELGEALVGLALSAWIPEEFGLVVRLHRTLAAIAERIDDEQFTLLSDAVGALARFSDADLDAATDAAHDVYVRAVAADNLYARWVATSELAVAALLAEDPAAGIPWIERTIRTHIQLGSRAAGMFIETRANFAVQAEDYLHAARLYAAARTHARRAAMPWPRRRFTDSLLARAREQLSPRDYELAWAQGEHMRMVDVAPAE